MQNPFDTIDARLSNIESLLLSIKHEKPNSSRSSDQPLTIEEAAKWCKCAKSTVRNAVRSGKLNHHRQTGRLYFFESDLKGWIKG